MTRIDHTNYDTLLKQSTNPRGASPDGNVYFDLAGNEIQLIGVDELALIDFGGGPVTNPLNNTDGITLRGLYNFENQERRTDEDLREFLRGVAGKFRFAGAFAFINGVKLDGTDRNKVRGSGWIEYADTQDGATDIDRIYHGVLSLVDIQAGTTPRWTLVTATDEATLQAATWAAFVRAGDIDEAVQVYGDTAFGDTGAGDFDYTTRTLVVRVRSWGYNPGETTSVATGIAEFSGFSAGYGVGESINPANAYDLADVYGGAAVSPWDTMTLEKMTGVDSGLLTLSVVAATRKITRGSGDFTADGFHAGHTITTTGFTNSGNNGTWVIESVVALEIVVVTGTGMVDETGSGDERVQSAAQVETGFNEADGSFTWVMHNPDGGTVQECAAFLDALTLQDSDVDDGTGTYNGQKGRVWYSRNASGKVVTASIGSTGLFIEGLSTAEKQNVIQTDDAGNAKTYPYFPEVQITVGAPAIADTNAWYHLFYVDGAGGQDFDTSSAVTVNDASGDPVKGNVSADQVGGKISFAYAYDTNTQAGLPAGVDKDVVAVVEGDGGAAQAITYFTITRTAVVAVTCAPLADTNA